MDDIHEEIDRRRKNEVVQLPLQLQHNVLQIGGHETPVTMV